MRFATSLVVIAVTLSACGPDRSQRDSDESLAMTKSRPPPLPRDEDMADDNEETQARRRLDEKQQKKLISKWADEAEAKCAETLDADYCKRKPAMASDGDADACKTACEKGFEAGVLRVLGAAMDDCLDRYVGGDKAALCRVAFPPAARADPAKAAGVNDRCSKQCQADGPAEATKRRDAVNEEKTGEARVLAYKKCMMATDSSLPARKAELYDRAVYNDLMVKTDQRCRSAQRCDRLEELTSFHCEYTGHP